MIKRSFLLASLLLALLLPAQGWAVSWPLKVSASGNYLEDQAGVPFLVVGDAAWSLAVQLNTTELATYLDDRQARGFTAILVNAIESNFSDDPPNNAAGDPPFTNGVNDWAVRNAAYWSHLDTVLNEAKSRNIVVFFFPAYIGFGCGGEGWCANMQAQSNAAMLEYGQFIGDRYKNQGNIIWVHGGDANAADYANALARVQNVASGIDSADTGNHLRTAHSAPERSALDDYSSIIDVNTTYSYSNPQSEVQNDYQRVGALPYTFFESHYENMGGSTITSLQSQAYIGFFGGALLGHIFGNAPIWSFDSGWEAALDDAGSVFMGHAHSLLQSRAWFRFVPDYANAVVTSSKGTGINYKATSRTSDGETVMVWNPTTATVTVQMTQLAGSTAHAWWWNPDTNATTDLGTFATTGTQVFTPPAARRILVLDNEASGLAAPGSTVYSTTVTPSRFNLSLNLRRA